MIPEPIPFVAAPQICPFVLLDAHEWPCFQTYGNGMTFVAVYRSKRGAKLGQRKWGGRIFNRLTGEYEA